MSKKDQNIPQPVLFDAEEMGRITPGDIWEEKNKPVTCLGMEFPNDDARRKYFRDELRKKLPELRQIEGFPIGKDEDIIRLSDPPYYTACPNPWLNDFIAQWEEEKKQLEREGKRKADFEVKEPYASDVSEGKSNAIYMAHSYHTKVPHPAIMRYILHYTQPGDIIFDGFAGTGMTGVAAGKCSDVSEIQQYSIQGDTGIRHCILGDLSPIASFITYNFNKPVSNNFFLAKAKQVAEQVNEKYGYLYKTKHKNLGYGVISYVIWSDELICDNCGRELSYWTESLDKDNNIKDCIICPHCGSIINKTQNTIAKETVVSINGDVAIVPKKRPVLICYKYNGKRYTKVPDDYDFQLIQEIESLSPDGFFPKGTIPYGVKTAELKRAGYTDVSLLYTRRNLLIFSALWSLMQDLPILRFVLTSILVKTGSLLHNIGLKNGKINLAGALPNALFVPSALAERNIIELFLSKLDDILRMNPEALHRCVNQISSATDLQNINSESVDYIFTDPPFGHNLMYSELNFIHEAWLNVFTDNKEEAIENSAQNKTVQDYTDLMTAAFIEYYRILKPGCWMTVEFSNTSAAVWNSIQRALTKAGFIVSVVRGLDKKQGSYNAQTTSTAVKQDLVISCYKSTERVRNSLTQELPNSVWDFIDEHLEHLPIVNEVGNKLTSIIERSPKILYDRLISSYIERGLAVPLDAQQFQSGLRERYVERDEMYFTASQVVEYEAKRKAVPDFAPMGIIVSDEANGIQWLKNLLRDGGKTYRDIQPEWMQAINGLRKNDILPELKQILEENFIEESNGKWRLPNIQDDKDVNALRTKALLKDFKIYVDVAQKPKAKIKEARVEALRAGFKQCYVDKDFQTIVTVGNKIPQNLLTEDEVLLQFYDIAQSKL